MEWDKGRLRGDVGIVCVGARGFDADALMFWPPEGAQFASKDASGVEAQRVVFEAGVTDKSGVAKHTEGSPGLLLRSPVKTQRAGAGFGGVGRAIGADREPLVRRERRDVWTPAGVNDNERWLRHIRPDAEPERCCLR